MKKLISLLLATITICSFMLIPANAATATSVWETEPNDSYVTADELDINGVIGAVCSSSNDEDYFVIEATENGKVDLYFNTEYINTSKYVEWHIKVIVESNGEYTTSSSLYIHSNSDKYSGTANLKITTLGVEVGNKYYVVVEGFNGDITPGTPTYAVGKEYSISSTFTKNSIIDIADPSVGETIGNTFNGVKEIFNKIDFVGTINSILPKLISAFETIMPYFAKLINIFVASF